MAADPSAFRAPPHVGQRYSAAHRNGSHNCSYPVESYECPTREDREATVARRPSFRRCWAPWRPGPVPNAREPQGSASCWHSRPRWPCSTHERPTTSPSPARTSSPRSCSRCSPRRASSRRWRAVDRAGARQRRVERLRLQRGPPRARRRRQPGDLARRAQRSIAPRRPRGARADEGARRAADAARERLDGVMSLVTSDSRRELTRATSRSSRTWRCGREPRSRTPAVRRAGAHRADAPGQPAAKPPARARPLSHGLVVPRGRCRQLGRRRLLRPLHGRRRRDGPARRRHRQGRRRGRADGARPLHGEDGSALRQPAVGGLRVVDEALREQASSLVTLVCAQLSDPEHDGAASVVLASGGHPLPLLVDRDGAVRSVGTEGLVLGAIEGGTWSDHRFALAPGETLLFYTDGATDAPGEGERFGEPRLELAAIGPGDPAALVARIDAAIDGFQDDREGDDRALLAIQYTPSAAALRPRGDDVAHRLAQLLGLVRLRRPAVGGQPLGLLLELRGRQVGHQQDRRRRASARGSRGRGRPARARRAAGGRAAGCPLRTPRARAAPPDRRWRSRPRACRPPPRGRCAGRTSRPARHRRRQPGWSRSPGRFYSRWPAGTRPRPPRGVCVGGLGVELLHHGDRQQRAHRVERRGQLRPVRVEDLAADQRRDVVDREQALRIVEQRVAPPAQLAVGREDGRGDDAPLVELRILIALGTSTIFVRGAKPYSSPQAMSPSKRVGNSGETADALAAPQPLEVVDAVDPPRARRPTSGPRTRCRWRAWSARAG